MFRLLILSFGLLLLAISSKAQTLQSPQSVELLSISTGVTTTNSVVADSLTNPMTMFGTTDQFIYKINLTVPDTINVETIHVSIGTTSANDLGVLVFNFADASNPNYLRDGNQLCLILGTYSYSPSITTSVFFEDANGNKSETTIVNSNF